jgi:uncharacterized repeat protein (TIGR03803 family)
MRNIQRSYIRVPSRVLGCLLGFLFCVVSMNASPRWVFKPLVSFNGNDGASPYNMSLVQGPDGGFYGTTSNGGKFNAGTVFKLDSSGDVTTLYNFCAQSDCADGDGPSGGLVLAANGDFYGTTLAGGTHDDGTVFKITESGTLTTLHNFCSKRSNGFCADGSEPNGVLVWAKNGNFYGTTEIGGSHRSGTVFKMTPSGAVTTLYNFCDQTDCTDGSGPASGMIQAKNGDLYGTTNLGGVNKFGTIFRITLSGTLTTLYSFCAQTNCTDGSYPFLDGLVQAASGTLAQPQPAEITASQKAAAELYSKSRRADD